MSLKLQFFNKDGTEEYEGFTITPSHICETISMIYIYIFIFI